MDRKYKKFLLFGFLILLPGCAYPINRYNAQKYHESGLWAEQKGDYQLAKQNYSRALLNAEWGHSPISGKSMVTYNLGRVTGYLCEFEEAERLLLEALSLQQKVPLADDPDHTILSMRYFELGRFYYDYGYYDQAILYLEKGIPIAEKLDIEKSDPIAFAYILDEYEVALRETNQINKAESIKTKSAEIRRVNSGKYPIFVPKRYNQNC